ncbi:histidine phosphatase family protein [Rhodococcus sp. BP-149]|uniref:histidine phosphatase family protein n=1 Tax=unclassified Rhodococcus (in: high G+C Gram-positive bacteria) TaxID=192944 RepID=UPI001C9A7237|nr:MULTISPECIES: histidine phosphatase family protein [unclassified Rhodococcus (in: high G+C Gram-positive bacteria)]MBY6687837.1 histidine phosphatase family protein [Rhodococcus sp. BP-288]MBY6696224.1 histidine phosphatase family protein [Rhodococcus sp. BP-188]MBY6700770.1 histidine phosphatase family protein [Rhodococcus sp. BP-285]MBY6701657.1 histidine phosphatase family protein [Rhodococcus sp. BP-283]MBY6712658.1 histidine phosphatase family protein [Rhodococcus sp. BP-160]
MQLLLIRHALPLRSDADADPALAPLGLEQAARVPDGLRAHRLARIVSSPQLRARQTAEPLAADTGLPVDVLDGLAEYDRDFPGYLPIEEAREKFPVEFERIKAGHLPSAVDADAFRRRVFDDIASVVRDAEPEDTVAVFAHGGVINVHLQDLLGTAMPLTFPIDYVSVTRILFSRSGRRTVASVNETQHVWDLLPRNRARSSPTS